MEQYCYRNLKGYQTMDNAMWVTAIFGFALMLLVFTIRGDD